MFYYGFGTFTRDGCVVSAKKTCPATVVAVTVRQSQQSLHPTHTRGRKSCKNALPCGPRSRPGSGILGSFGYVRPLRAPEGHHTRVRPSRGSDFVAPAGFWRRLPAIGSTFGCRYLTLSYAGGAAPRTSRLCFKTCNFFDVFHINAARRHRGLSQSRGRSRSGIFSWSSTVFRGLGPSNKPHRQANASAK